MAAFEKAIELNPNYADAYRWLSNVLTGPDDYGKRRLVLREKAVKLDPMSEFNNSIYSQSLVSFGRFEDAEQVIQHIKKVNPSSRSVNFASYFLRQNQHRYGEATYYALKINQYNATNISRLNLTENYNRLGLNQLTADVFKNDRFEFLGHSYTNLELARSEARGSVPRSAADVLGAFHRAFTEYIAGNYIDAVHYFLLSGFICTNCNQLIFSYLQLDDFDSAEPLLEKRKRRHQIQLREGLYSLGTKTVNVDAADLALLDSNLSKAMSYLKLAMDKGLILDRWYQYLDPLYEPLRGHPDWPALLAESEKRATEQREIYLKLVAEDNEIVQ